MQTVSTDRFSNEPSRRFYNFFNEKIRNKEIDLGEFCQHYDVADSNKSGFLSGLKQGKRSITLEHISIAYEYYGLLPDYIFGVTDQPIKGGDFAFADPEPDYGQEYRVNVGKKLRDILEKHKTNISRYADQRLKMTEQNLFKIMRGQGRAYWDQVVTIFEDHGESLDQLRSLPLPKGHLLEQIKTLKSLNEALVKRVDELKRN